MEQPLCEPLSTPVPAAQPLLSRVPRCPADQGARASSVGGSTPVLPLLWGVLFRLQEPLWCLSLPALTVLDVKKLIMRISSAGEDKST